MEASERQTMPAALHGIAAMTNRASFFILFDMTGCYGAVPVMGNSVFS